MQNSPTSRSLVSAYIYVLA